MTCVTAEQPPQYEWAVSLTWLSSQLVYRVRTPNSFPRIIPLLSSLCNARRSPQRLCIYLLWLILLWCRPGVSFKCVFNLEWKGRRKIQRMSKANRNVARRDRRKGLTEWGEGTDSLCLFLLTLEMQRQKGKVISSGQNGCFAGESTHY